MKSFKENVRILMILNGYRATDMANAVGLTRARISKILNGESAPSIETLEKFAEALSTTPSALIMGDEVDFEMTKNTFNRISAYKKLMEK